MDILTVLDGLGRISTVIVIVSFLYTIYLWIRGIAPVLVRLGNGLARRKIALFAKGDMLVSLESLLHDSKLFNQANIVKIATDGDIEKAADATLFLLAWHDWEHKINEILAEKKEGTALIVYAPQEKGFIPSTMMTLLNSKRNVVVSNFRGRLLNDVVSSMITTSYEKK